MEADHQLIGKIGRLSGGIDPGEMGEVMVPVRGGTEAYLAWSEQPLARGKTVLVYATRGGRTLDVMEWAESSDDPGGPPTT